MRTAGSIVLIIAGGVVLETTLTGTFRNYVKPGHGPLLLVVGAAVVLLGIAGYVHDARHPEFAERARRRAATLPTVGPLRVERAEVERARRLDREHDHYRTPSAGWLLCLPALLVLLVPPPPIGAYSAERGRPTVPKPARADFRALPTGNPVALAVHDYAERAVWDHGRTLAGRTITLTGFVTPRPGGGWYLTRARITCCAADARSYLVAALGAAKEYPPNTWVRVTGSYASAGADPQTTPAEIQVADAVPINRPGDPYEQ